MTVVLQNLETLALVHFNGGWTRDRTAAREFETSHDALLFAAGRGITHVQLIYDFPESGAKVTAPVSDDYLSVLRLKRPPDSRPPAC